MCGITTVRDVASNTVQTLELRKKGAAGEIVAPRIWCTRCSIRRPNRRTGTKRKGVDGIKLMGARRDVRKQMELVGHNVGLPVAHHAGLGKQTPGMPSRPAPAALSTGTEFPMRRLLVVCRTSRRLTITATRATASAGQGSVAEGRSGEAKRSSAVHDTAVVSGLSASGA
jgi:hypothetical protein